MHHTLCRAAIVLAVLILGLSPVPVGAGPGDGQVVRIPFASQEALARLAARLDIWEVHRDEGYVLAYVNAEDTLWLEDAEFAPEVDPVRSFHPDTIPGYACYRTVSELYAQLSQWAAQFPDLVELSTAGQSYAGRPIYVLRITNRARVESKPVLFVIANSHGRELITPEVAMVFAQTLLQNYGTDPDVTWLLDHQDTYVMVTHNPDGHVMNEPGQPWAWWRKNVHPYGTCTKYGVDLNRNSTFDWGLDGYGSSGDPCAETYRGPAPHSEAETQAVENVLRSIFPDQRGAGRNDPAPQDAMGVFITLHSYGNLVLWPWGSVASPAPNAAGLQMLGRKLASINGYSSGQSYSGIYPTNGTTDDTAYGELGVAAYTFEIGNGNDGFYPQCSRYDALVQPNVRALIYAAKVARTPYLTSFGPDVVNLLANPAMLPAGQSLSVSATVDDSRNGGSAVARAEVFVDTPPWAGGTAHPLNAADGAYNGSIEDVQGTLSAVGLAPGRHTLYVRGCDAPGYCGPVSAVFFFVQGGTVAGTVRRSTDAQPVAGAAVDLQGAGGIYHASTDSAGEYVVSVPEGSYTATVAAAGYISQTVTGLVVATDLTTTRDFSLVPLVRGVDLAPASAVGHAGPGDPVTYTLRITNTGNAADAFEAIVAGEQWQTHASAIPALAAGAAADLTVRVVVAPDAWPGVQDLATVTVTSRNDPTVKDTASLITTADLVRGFSLAPAEVARVAPPGSLVSHVLQLTNTGNVTETFTVATVGTWAMDAPSPSVTLPPFGGVALRTMVTIPGDATVGMRDTATVTVAAQAGSLPPATSRLTTIAGRPTFLPMAYR